MHRFRARSLALVVGLAVAVLASACRVETTVEIEVEDNGSGTVTVTVVADSDAVALVPDLPDDLRLDDLESAGWTAEDPQIDAAGGLTVVVSKRFDTAAELPSVLAEIAGEGVVFEDVELDDDHSFPLIALGPATTDYTLSGTVDPAPDLEQLGTDALVPPLGRSVAKIEQDAGAPLNESLDLTLVVTMPSDLATTSESASVDEETATWTWSYGDSQTELDATASTEDIIPRVWAVVALVALAGLALVLLSRLAGWVLAKLRTPKGRRTRDVRQRQQRAEQREEEASRPRARLLRLVVMDVHGVVARPTDPVEGLLLPLVTGEQPDIDPQAVRDAHRQVILGRISTDEFWSDLGLGPVADEMETRYLSSFRLVAGLHPFLDRMAASQLPVAAIGNQPAGWGERLKRMASLDGVIASWLVSGDVGAALPDPSLFEATRRTMSVDLYDCFYLSSVPAHLDAAQELGMATGLFVADGDEPMETNHSVIRGFDDLLRGRGG